MKKRTVFEIMFIFALSILIVSGKLVEAPKETSYQTSQYSYAETFKVMITGDELKWVDRVEINNKEIKITAKDEADRTYNECVLYDEKEEIDLVCLKYENIIYEVPVSMPIRKENNDYIQSIQPSSIEGKDVLSYQIKPDEHYIKIGEDTIYIIQDMITGASLVNITSKKNFTHLNISKIYPYSNLTLYLPFDNTSTTVVYDYSRSENDGGMVGDAFITSSGKYGGALELDGDVDYVRIQSADYKFTSSNFSVSFWANPFVMDNTYDGLVTADPGDDSWKIVRVANSNSFHAEFHTVNNLKYPTVSINEWHHYGYVKNGTNLTIYFDGVITNSTTAPVSHTDQGTEFWIGTYRTSAQHYFNGLIDEVMIFDTPLTPGQMLDIYNNKSNRFLSTGTHGLNQTIVAGAESVEVIGELQTELNSSINLSLGYYDGSWTQTIEQVFDGNNTFTISITTTEIALNFTYFAGSNNGDYDFYSPILLGENGISMSAIIPCPYSGSGDWNVNQYCEYTFTNQNVNGNLNILDGGTMNFTASASNINFTSNSYKVTYDATDDFQVRADGNWTINSP